MRLSLLPNKNKKWWVRCHPPPHPLAEPLDRGNEYKLPQNKTRQIVHSGSYLVSVIFLVSWHRSRIALSTVLNPRLLAFIIQLQYCC